MQASGLCPRDGAAMAGLGGGCKANATARAFKRGTTPAACSKPSSPSATGSSGCS
ncbi:hypothetical protein R2601_04373 [Salipiger bermudensis HTCC2601]|uniref:Uncharacterized protein n=1 Tax=Salipiger bermudensis (strain DSM 26914 / JCM 13377 / KCTC 12554 / HTCC2601) TaxID=314265 RepID=Q0FVX1_SALBH|nr:hypothetical protein R2601_04373 [Salipiger bermudensis HTCC2601]